MANNMQRMEGSFTPTSQIKLFTLTWLPDGDPNAIVILVHGVGEHAGRYEGVAKRLVNAGYAVYGYDHQGHGRSDGTKTYFKDGIPGAVTDLTEYAETVMAAHAGKPFFLYGHSMGSLITLLHLLNHQDKYTGWVSTGNPVHSDQVVAGPLVQLVKAVGSVIPKARLIKLEGGGISSEPDEVAAYDNDPLVDRNPLRVGMVSQIFKHAASIRPQLDQVTLPMLIMHGADDPIAPASGSQYVYDHVGSADKTLKIFPAQLHEIHHERDTTEFFADLLAWLDRQTTA